MQALEGVSVTQVGERDFLPLRPLSGRPETSAGDFEEHVTTNMPPPKPGVPFFILLFLAVCATLGGWSVFALCFFSYKNYQAALWALASGIFACGVLHLQVLHLSNKLDIWHDKKSLGGLKVLGIIVASVSMIASGTYFALVVTRHQAFAMVSGNIYPSAVFSLLTLVWGLLLFGSAKHCQRVVQDAHPSLLSYGGFGHPRS